MVDVAQYINEVKRDSEVLVLLSNVQVNIFFPVSSVSSVKLTLNILYFCKNISGKYTRLGII